MGRLRAGEFCWTVANLPSLCPHPTWHPRGPAYVERGVELTDLGLKAVAVLAVCANFAQNVALTVV
jgi:hypothetical protein